MKGFILFLGLYFTSFFLVAQSGSRPTTSRKTSRDSTAQRIQLLSAEAQNDMKELDYFSAVQVYEKLYKLDPRNMEFIRNAAFCCKILKSYKDAEVWYSRIIQSEKPSPLDIYTYAQLLRYNYKYPESSSWLDRYHTMVKGRLMPEIYKADGNSYLKDSLRYVLKTIPGLNSSYSDYSSFVRQNVLYFVSERPDSLHGGNSNFQKFFGGVFDPMDEEDEKAPASFTKLYTFPLVPVKNTKRKIEAFDLGIKNEQTDIGSFIPGLGGTEYYVTLGVYGRKDTKKIARLKIQHIQKSSKDSMLSEPFVFDSFDDMNKYSVGHPAISKDGSTLYFASNMPGTIGGTDLWRCRKNGAKWGVPENLGPYINSHGKELFPSLTADGNLIFASEGLPGLGGLDIFIAQADGKGGFLPAVNIGYPVNSCYDDFAYFEVSSALAYFSSNRPGGRGDDDIYELNIDPKLPLSALKKTIPVTSPISASQKASLPTGTAPSIAQSQSNLESIENEIIPAGLGADRNSNGKISSLSRVFFQTNSSILTAASIRQLNSLLDSIQKFPKAQIRIDTYTDCRGLLSKNLQLSKNRSAIITRYLLQRGISPQRISSHNYGPENPIVPCDCDRKSGGAPCTEVEHTINRRSEIYILHKN